MNNITLIIAYPEPRLRERITQGLNREPGLTVLATTSDLMNTYNEVELRQPSAVLIASSLASKPEFEVMRALFATLDVRWLVIEENNFAPHSPKGSDLFAVKATDSPSQLAGRVREVTHRHRNSAPSPISSGTHSAPQKSNDRLILIGSSTGGVDALLTVLSSFPINCPPTLIVQHTGGGFGKSLVRLLNRQCAANVELATHGASVQNGTILVAAGTKAHLVISKNSILRTELKPSTPISGHMPSVDALFESAIPYAERVVAAILTGMGNDGAAGMKALRDRGAMTIAQDQATSVVYGMPRAAVENGGAHSSLPLHSIGPAVIEASRSPVKNWRGMSA